MHSHFSPLQAPERLRQDIDTAHQQAQRTFKAMAHHGQAFSETHGEKGLDNLKSLAQAQWQLWQRIAQGKAWEDTQQYLTDSAQRTAMTLETLQQRAENDRAHEDAGMPPVLVYAHEVVMDGRDLPRPVNYQLLHILPPEGVETFAWKRPYVIIDPRAGHGAGIGGFKTDSQVGVALRAGHPVYFVVFRQEPEPGQTLADVMRAEVEFVREVSRRHPESPKPVIVGNCQGGWATLVLAAANPDITGPLVINGAPVSSWSGEVGANPMRYNGGLLGGVVPALLSADLGDGKFDGAHLVSNFEMLNPSRNFVGKYYDLYANVDQQRESFLEFERWWGGFHYTNEAEIRWIVEQIFVGNRLSRGEAELEPGRHLDLKNIRSPIIVFASRGDNITPPQQALNWIVDTYADETEIRVRGQKIIYMVHDKVGHLGIFVSSSIARKEHAEMNSTLKTIEAMAPGLYEMVIEETHGEGDDTRFSVSFIERKLSDVLAVVPNDREQEKDFRAVARLSELGANFYEIAARPMVQAVVTPQLAEQLREAHPSRVSRRWFSSDNPALAWVGPMASWSEANRQPADPSNPWTGLERSLANLWMQGIDAWRDLRDASYESAFLSLYGSPFMRWIGKDHGHPRTLRDPSQLRYLPEVQANLARIEKGGLAEAVIRILILLAESRGSVRRDRLERSHKVQEERAPFAAMTPGERSALIREQSVIVEFETAHAIDSLPKLLTTPKSRQQAMDMVYFVVGDRNDMEPRSLHTLSSIEQVLGLTSVQTPAEATSETTPDAA